MDELFTQIENYEKMNIECLSVRPPFLLSRFFFLIYSFQFSKIGKVMRHIISLPEGKIPDESEEQYRFRERAKALTDKWQLILNATKPPPTGAASSSANANANANGNLNGINGNAGGDGDITLGDVSMMSALPADTTLDAVVDPALADD